MKADRIAEIRALLDAATPGPWCVVAGPMGNVPTPRLSCPAASVYQSAVPTNNVVAPNCLTEADARLIAAAREALQELIAEVERLRDLDAARDVLIQNIYDVEHERTDTAEAECGQWKVATLHQSERAEKAEAECERLRAKNAELNRRAQAAESAAGQSVEAAQQGGPSLGRALANYSAKTYLERAEKAEAECERLRADVARLMCCHPGG